MNIGKFVIINAPYRVIWEHVIHLTRRIYENGNSIRVRLLLQSNVVCHLWVIVRNIIKREHRAVWLSLKHFKFDVTTRRKQSSKKRIPRFRPTISCTCALSKLQSKWAHPVLFSHVANNIFLITDILHCAYPKCNCDVIFFFYLSKIGFNCRSCWRITIELFTFL